MAREAKVSTWNGYLYSLRVSPEGILINYQKKKKQKTVLRFRRRKLQWLSGGPRAQSTAVTKSIPTGRWVLLGVTHTRSTGTPRRGSCTFLGGWFFLKGATWQNSLEDEKSKAERIEKDAGNPLYPCSDVGKGGRKISAVYLHPIRFGAQLTYLHWWGTHYL